MLDADIRDFFTSIDHSWLLKFLEHRIADRRVLRLIQKWLRAGVIEDGTWSETRGGTAQGASASPLLANVYLHYVFDLWAHQWRRRHARGEVIIVRYADDYIVGFQHQRDAQRFLADLRDRLAKFGLELARRQDPADRVRALCRREPRCPWAAQAGDVRLPGLQAHLLEDPERALHAQAHHRRWTDAGQAAARSTSSSSAAGISRSPSKASGWEASSEATWPTTPCPATATRSSRSTTRSRGTGYARFGVEASATTCAGIA